MEYRALIEKLDWKGDVVRTVKKYEDPSFMPDMTRFFREVIETGEVKTKELPEPKYLWQVESIAKKIVPAKSQYCFAETERGLREIVGEFYPALSAQFTIVDTTLNFSYAKWIKTDCDILQGVEDGV